MLLGRGDAQNFINDLLVEMHADALACATKNILGSSDGSMTKYLSKCFRTTITYYYLSMHIKCGFIGLHNYTCESYWCSMFV